MLWSSTTIITTIILKQHKYYTIQTSINTTRGSNQKWQYQQGKPKPSWLYPYLIRELYTPGDPIKPRDYVQPPHPLGIFTSVSVCVCVFVGMCVCVCVCVCVFMRVLCERE